jgi:hypothetical protein
MFEVSIYNLPGVLLISVWLTINRHHVMQSSNLVRACHNSSSRTLARCGVGNRLDVPVVMPPMEAAGCTTPPQLLGYCLVTTLPKMLAGEPGDNSPKANGGEGVHKLSISC